MSIAKWLLARKLGGGGGEAIIKRKTGNPIELTDAASAPMVKCVTAITGSQDLHGYDKPWVGGAGRNKFNQVDTTIDGFSNTDGTYTNTLTDSKTSLQPAVRWYKNGAFVNANTGAYIQSSGRYRLTVNAGGQEYDEIRFGHNGSTRDLIISYPLGYSTTNIMTISFTIDGFNPSVVSGLTISEIELEVGQKTAPDPYYPYSNICPITAYTEGEIEVRGRNLWSLGNLTVATDAGISFALKSGTYTFQAVSNTNVDGITIRFNYEDSTSDVITIYRPDFSGKSLTLSKNVTTINYNIPNFTTGTIISNIQIERGETPHDYEPYVAPTTHTTTYPSAIYRGREDVVNGEVESEWRKISITNVALYGNYGKDNAPLFYADISGGNIAPYSNTTLPIGNKPISNFYTPISASTESDMEDFEFRTNNSKTEANRFYFRDSRFTTAADFNAYIANNPIEIAFKLATPTTSSVTPTNLPIKSLSGYNHIESTTGDMTIDYITDAYQNFVNTVESALPNTTRNLLSASKGGTKAMDIFLSLEKRDDKEEEVKEETKDDMR